MVGERRHFPKKHANATTRHEQKKKYCPIQHQLVINEKKIEDRERFSYPILCLLCNLHQRNQIKTKFMQLRIYFNVACKILGWFLPFT